MLSLTLYNNRSESNKVDKNITEIITLEGQLLDSTSVMHPSIKIYLAGDKIEGYVVEDNQEYVVYNGTKLKFEGFIYDVVLTANYARISAFNRYYFITDIISVRRNIWQLELQVDVLMTYKKDFLKLKGFIDRNENQYVMDAVDELRDFHYPKQIYYDQITHVEDFTPDVFTIYGSYLASVSADDANTQPNQPSYQPNDIGNNLHVKITDLVQGINNNLLFYTGTDSQQNMNPLFKAIYENSNLHSFVKYLKSYPFVIEQKNFSDTPIGSTYTEGVFTKNYHIGDKDDIYSVNSCYMPEYNVIVKCMADFVLDDFLGYSYQNEWLKAEPYTIVEIWIPFYNYVKIPYIKVHDHELRLYYITTIGDGDTTAILYDVDDDKILFSSKVECSTNIPLSTTNQYENEKKKDALITSTAIGTLSSVVSTALGVVTKNPVMVAGGVMGGVSTVTKAITSASQIFETANVSSASVTSGVFNSLVPFIKRTIQSPITLSDEATYNHLYGKPLKRIMTLNQLTGFTKVSEIIIDGIKNISKAEEDELISLLQSGIIL